jgi:hypothetical protein
LINFLIDDDCVAIKFHAKVRIGHHHHVLTLDAASQIKY